MVKNRSEIMERILVTKVCMHCGKVFQTISSAVKYCSDRCAKNAKEEQKRTERIQRQKQEALERRHTSLLSQEFINITDAATLIGVSRPTVYKMIEDGRIEAVRFGERIVRIKVASLSNPAAPVLREKPKTQFAVSKDNLISKNQVMEEYQISDTQFYRLIKPHSLQAIYIDGLSYFSEPKIRKILDKGQYPDIKEWYTMAEVVESSKMKPNSVSDFCKTHSIPRKKDGIHVLISKKHWDAARGNDKDMLQDYYSVPEVIKKYRRCRSQVYQIIRLNKMQKIKIGNFVYVSKKEIDKYFKEV